jgi:hypothetical protein
MTTQIDLSSLTEGQLTDLLASPMSELELRRLASLEAELRDACLEQYRAELQQGQALLELRDHPRLLWQRDPMFKTKAGGWVKTRSWDRFVRHHELAESGTDADRLIAQWQLHERTLAAAARLQEVEANA